MWKSENINDLFVENTEQNVSIEIGLHLPKYGTQTMEADQTFKGILCLSQSFRKYSAINSSNKNQFLN
jgi:hypothetical protein